MNEFLINALSTATNVTTFDPDQVDQLDDAELLDESGTLRPMPSAWWAAKAPEQRAIFGNKHGIYAFPTHEAVSFVRDCIAGRERQTLEIGAGNGGWGKALGIRSTDSFLQRRPDVAAKYASMRQPTVRYGSHVEKLEAIKAVRKYRPKIVLASWVTQKFRADRFCMRGNADGVDELRMLDMIEEYILIGNTEQHSDKMIIEDIQRGVSRYMINGIMFEGVASRALVGRDFIFHFKRK
ncbi:hypothetical protein GTB64_004516 [Salmonella enterica]|nr:hypothetical protein [Salmonella enterica]